MPSNSKNPDVDRILRVLAAMPAAAKVEVEDQLDKEADALVETMQGVAARGQTERLVQSIRKEKGDKPFQRMVKAGGPLTTKPVRKGQSARYDYALGAEFSNEHTPASPFFWNSVKFRGRSIRRNLGNAGRRGIRKAIKAGQ